MTKKFYVTTPIYYVNGVPHIGTATTTLIADAVVRFHRLRGESCFLLTGTDEHAQKVADAAAAAGETPQQFVDHISQRFAETWDYLHVQYDQFIRTSDPRHKYVVGEVFQRLQATGDVYKGVYEGWYSVADETFFRDTDVENGYAKETGAKVERVTEENYYFRLSAYGDKLLQYIEANPDFLQPETRRNEVIAFINQGLRDVPVSRRNTGWGIPAPGDDSQTVYVWFDALINYLTATGWPDGNWQDLWPADAHLVGKEIYTRFHATLWPAMLMGLGIALPKHVIGHAWWLIGGEKGAKSKGNIPTPQEAAQWIIDASGAKEEIAIDAVRYYLLRDISFTSDVEFSFENLTVRFNGELANNIGNLLNRSLNMLQQYEGGVIPDAAEATRGSIVALAAIETASLVEAEMEAYRPGPAIEAIARFADVANKAIGVAEPWKKHKQGDRAAVASALYTALEANRLISVFLAPFLPSASVAIREQLGLTAPATWSEARQWGILAPGSSTQEATVLFPRIDVQKASRPAPAAPATPAPKKEALPVTEISELISIGDFAKVQLRIATILTAAPVEGAKKLLLLTIDIGEETPRQLVAGIAESYSSDDLPGKKIVVIANLQPATIRGVQSNGMLLAATDSDGKAILLIPDNPETPAGSKIR